MKMYSRLATSLLLGESVALPLDGLPAEIKSIRRGIQRELTIQRKILNEPDDQRLEMQVKEDTQEIIFNLSKRILEYKII